MNIRLINIILVHFFAVGSIASDFSEARNSAAIGEVTSCSAFIGEEEFRGTDAKSSFSAMAIKENIEAAHSQDRNEKQYFQDMDASMGEKWEVIFPEVNDYLKTAQAPVKICDIGTGTGRLAAELAKHLIGANVKVIGTDIIAEYVKLAQATHTAPNLRFKHVSADETCVNLKNKRTSTAKIGADITIFSSILHEVYSYGGDGDSDQSLKNAIAKAYQSLAPHGRIIIRDFVAPPDEEKFRNIVLLHRSSDIRTGKLFETHREMSCENFAIDFAKIRNKQTTTRKDISCYEFSPCEAGFRCYKTNLATAYEFIYRKDYNDSYGAELNERYGFMSEEKARKLVEGAGFKVLKLQASLNPWVREYRLENKVIILDAHTKEKLPYPNYQLFLVAEKRAL